VVAYVGNNADAGTALGGGGATAGAPASGFGGAGFFAAGLAGEGLANEGAGAGGGAVWARAGCATASASIMAAVRITTSSSLDPRGEYALEQRLASCIRKISTKKGLGY
jgi:hypothetical protein